MRLTEVKYWCKKCGYALRPDIADFFECIKCNGRYTRHEILEGGMDKRPKGEKIENDECKNPNRG